MENEGKALLMQKLRTSLQEHAKALGGTDDLPDIRDIYELMEMATLHLYLVDEHQFTPQEVNELLKFEDPMEVAYACWEENPDRYDFDICYILKEHDYYMSYPLVSNPVMSEK